VLESLEKGNVGSQSPCHPNNVRSTIAQLTAGDRVVVEPTSISLTATTTIAPLPKDSDVQLNYIEIVPSTRLQERVKMEEGADNRLTGDDLAIIDTALNLDPSLTDLTAHVCYFLLHFVLALIWLLLWLQNNLWDDFDDPSAMLTTCE
jgi:hypothetical protein